MSGLTFLVSHKWWIARKKLVQGVEFVEVERNNYRCLAFVGDKSKMIEHIIDARNKASNARFINHSCDPNCYTEVVSSGGANKIVVLVHNQIENH